MNTKNNRRRRESVKKIEKVFFDLLSERELNRITVSDICKCAGINRSTFYDSFADVYELADRIRERLEKEVWELYRDKPSPNIECGDFIKLFSHIRDNQDFYRTYFKLGYAGEPNIRLYNPEQALSHLGMEKIKYHLEFFRSGFNAVVKLWLDGGCRETPEELEEVIKREYSGRF